MKEKYPLVSIIIPVYNGSNYMRSAIDSALSQTYKNIEVIVVNDGSTDDTEKIALSYGERIRYFKKENGGVSSALNYGMKVMKGQYFSWLSHDDEYVSTKIESQINTLFSCGEFNESIIAYCDTLQIDKNSRLIKKPTKNKYLKENKVNDWRTSIIALVKSGSFSGCSLLIPKKILDSVGEFDERMRFSQDFLMWSKMLIAGNSIFYVSDGLVMNRIHDGQLTQRGRDVFYKDILLVAQILYDPLKKHSTKKNNYIYIYAKYFAKYNCKDALKMYEKLGKNESLFSFFQLFSLKILGLYGKLRPQIRRLYYKLFKKVKTN